MSEKDKPKFVCPGCGSDDILQRVTLSGKRRGRFSLGSNGRPSFDGESESEIDSDNLELEDEKDFECQACNEEFDEPAILATPGAWRLDITLAGNIYHADEKGIEEELEAIRKKVVSVPCTSKKDADATAEQIKIFLGSILEGLSRREVPEPVPAKPTKEKK